MSLISIVLPAYNEDKNILNLVNELRKYLSSSPIVIVDDSPNNKTKDILKSLKEKDLQIHYIKRDGKLGRYSAVIRGMKYLVDNEVPFDFIVEMDTDFSHPPNEIVDLTSLAIKENSDICIASRDLPKSKIIGWPLIRKLMHQTARILCRTFIYKGLNDFFNAYRVYSKRVVLITVKDKKRKFNKFWGFGETLLNTLSIKGKIIERPTIFTNREFGKSSVNIGVIIKTIYEIIHIGLITKRKILKKNNFK